MKVIGINGSARKDGNTSLLIKAVFAELEAEGIETDLVQLHGKALEPCKACFGCGGKRQCVVKTDYFNECFAKMVEADGMVLGSPVYSADVTAGMKAFLERAGVVVATNPGMLRHKVGASVAAVRLLILQPVLRVSCSRNSGLSRVKLLPTSKRAGKRLW